MKKLLFLAPIALLANQIQNIEFIGLKHISQTTAKDISLVHKGDELNINKINQSIKKFYQYGYFDKIKADYNDGVLKYEFTEKPAILKIKYKNISEDLKKLLKDKLKRGMILSNDKLQEIRNFIVGYYDAKGKFNSVVVFDIKKEKNGVIITINVNKGEELTIEKLKLYGVKKEKISNIKDDLINKNKEYSLLHFIPFWDDNGDFSLRGLIEDPQKIRDYYLQKGYLDVKVSNPLFIANFDTDKADLSYKIHEGIRYKVKNVNITIDKNIINLTKLKENLHLRKNLYFDIRRLRKDINNLKRAVADKGYAYVRIIPDIKKENGLASVTYKIITGNKVYISNVIIEGNSKTLDRVIRRNIYLAPGYLYSLTDKEDSINALKRSGYFDDVQIKEIPVDSSHMKILVKVKEGLTGSLKAGISYNTYSHFGINFSISERNIFGSGQDLSLNFENTGKSTTYSFNLKNPRVLDSKYFLATSVYNSKFTGYSYDSHKQGFSLTSGRSITRHSNASLTYGYEHLNLTNIQDDTILYDKENSIKSYLSPSIGFNNTDNYYFPNNGIKSDLSILYAGVGGDQKFIKNTFDFKYFYSLEDRFNITTILKYKIKGGYIKENGYTPISEKFYLGGLGTVRGYNYGSISPKDSKNNSIGGDSMLVNSAEISVPVSIRKKMWLSAFIDNGRIGKNKMNIVRSSYGVSFDWITPIGPLDFTWAWPIGDKKGDDLRKFEFSIGSSF